MPVEEKEAGKRKQSLGNGIDPNEEKEDAGEKGATVDKNSTLQAANSTVDTVQQKNGVAGQQENEDSTPGPSEKVNLADEIEAA